MIKKIIYIFIIMGILYSKNDVINNNKYISNLKQQEIEYQYKNVSNQFGGDFLAPINTINVSITGSRDDSISKFNSFNSLLISVDQPIFQAGSIYFSFKYAFDNRKYNKLKARQFEKNTVIDAVITLYDLVIADYQVKKDELNLKNYSLSVDKKRSDFLKGITDSIDLNDTIRDKLEAEKVLLKSKQNRAELYNKWKSISNNTNYKKLKIPNFKLSNSSSYISKNIELNLAKSESRILKDQTLMFLGKSFLSVNAFYRNSRQENIGTDSSIDSINGGIINTYGLTLTVPFNFSNFGYAAKQRVDYLSSVVETIDKRREIKNNYNTYISDLKRVRDEIMISNKDLELYKSLLEDTKEQRKIGYKTRYDVSIFKNSYSMLELDLKILALQKNKILAQMYKEVE